MGIYIYTFLFVHLFCILSISNIHYSIYYILFSKFLFNLFILFILDISYLHSDSVSLILPNFLIFYCKAVWKTPDLTWKVKVCETKYIYCLYSHLKKDCQINTVFCLIKKIIPPTGSDIYSEIPENKPVACKNKNIFYGID